MKSLAFASQGECEPHSPEIHHWRRRVVSLESETEILGRIIRTHEATLEEISELVFQQLEGARQVTTHELMSHYTHSQNPADKIHPLEQQIHQEIARQIERVVSAYQKNFLKAFQGLIADHTASVGKLKKQLRQESRGREKAASERGDCDTSIEEHSPGKALFEIPVEMQVLKDVADSDVQVDIFSSAKSIYEVPVEMREIVEVPVELNRIFEVPIELNTLQVGEKHRVFEVPVEIDQLFEVEGDLNLYQEKPIGNLIYELPLFAESKDQDTAYEQENMELRTEIEKLLEELNELKLINQTSQKRIYEIPVELEPFVVEADINSSRCEVYMPDLESQNNLEKPQPTSRKYDIKHAESKISTQICTRPDLDLSPLHQRGEGKSSIILSHPLPIQESLSFPAHQASSLKNINFYVSDNHISQVESALEEGSEFIQKARDIPVEIEIDGEIVEIEMQIVQEAETRQQGVQTDGKTQKKGRVAKMPLLKVVEIPYEVERVVERIFKVPFLKIVEVPVEVETLQQAEVPVSTLVEPGDERVVLSSANSIQAIEKVVEAPKVVLVEVPVEVVVERVVVKEVPIEVVIFKQLPPRTIVKEVPIEVFIQKIVELPQRTIVKQLPMEVVIEKEVIVQREVVVEKLVQLPPKTIIKEIPMEVVVEKEVIVERLVDLPPKTIIREVPVEVIVQRQVIVEKYVELPVKTIIKEVPIEVIVQREVIVEKQVIVERFVELPQKTIIRQVPVEVIVEKIVEVPGKTIIREVPIEVIVQRQVIVEKIVQLPGKTIIKQVPVEVIVERQVQKVVDRFVHVFHEIPVQVMVEVKKIEVREVPVEVIVEKEVLVEREVVVEKVVQITKVKQVPMEVIIERVVEVPVIVEVPVEVVVERKVAIVREIPYEVVIIEEVEKFIEIPVAVIRQIPVEVMVEVQKIKIVKQVVEVPVMIYMQDEGEQNLERNLTFSEVPIKSDEPIVHQLLLQSHYPNESEQQLPRIIETPVEVFIEREVVKIREVPVELLTTVEVEVVREVPKIVQIPTELIIVEQTQKIVYIRQEKIVEVPVEVIVQKLVYIQKIVEVPVEVVIEKEIIIHNTQIVEVPIEVIVYKDRLVEVPVELFVEKIREVPVEIVQNEQFKLLEIPVEMEIIQQQKEAIKLQSLPEMGESEVVNFPFKRAVLPRKDYEFSYQIPAQVGNDGADFVYNIDARHLTYDHNEIIIEIPFSEMRGDVINGESQTESAISNKLSDEKEGGFKLNSKPSYDIEIVSLEVGIQTVQQGEKVRIIETPIEVENINFEQVQKEVEIKYREYLADLRERYGGEITQLSKSVVSLQSIILEANAEKENLREVIEGAALKEQSLLKELQFITKSNQQASEQFVRKIQQLQESVNRKTHEISELNEKIGHLELKSQKIHEIPVEIETENRIFEVMVEMETLKETLDQLTQTEDIQLVLPQIMEIPIEIELRQALDLPEELVSEVQVEQMVKVGRLNEADMNEVSLEDSQCQTEGKTHFIYEIPMEMNVVKAVESMQSQTDFTVQECEDIIILRQTAKNPYDIVEIPMEMIEPVVYEIPTEVKVVTQTQTAETQTQAIEASSQDRKIYELPVEYRPISQTNEMEIQTLPEVTSNRSEQSSNQEEKAEEDYESKEQRGRRSNNNYVRQQMSQDSFFKKKPYSEYFTSRIFEIPIEVNLNKEDPLSVKLLSTEVQTEASELNPVVEAGLSNIYLSRQRELVVSHLRIVPAFEPMKVVQEAMATPVRRSPERRIFRFGSENETLGLVNGNNFSNVQSMTPNQLDGSNSYDKFPVPTININNISLIKKSSIHSEGKFFGSLDMRDDLLNHDDALASVRIANRKLAGFEQGESSSEDGDIHNLSREMIIEENETIVSRDINRIQTPNLEPHDLNFSEYATLREKLYQPEEEKINYQELYDNAQTDLEGLRQKLYYKGEEVAELKVELDRESCRYEEEIRKVGEELAALRKVALEQEAALEGSRARVGELEEAKAKLERKIEMLFENWERLKDENEKGEIASGKEFERLRAIISEKLAEIKELRADEHHQKEAFEGQLHDYRQVVRQKEAAIDELEEQLQARNERIEELTDKLEEMRKSISHNNEAETAAIYEKEFERVKEVFEDEKRELNYQYLELKEQNQQLREAIAEEERRREDLEATVADLEREVEETRKEYSSLHHLKSELENNFVEGVKCLNQQLEEMKDLVREKDEIIHHYQPALHAIPQDDTPEQALSKFRIEYISKQPSLVAVDNGKQLEAYCRKLEGLLKKYERIITESQGRIEELQEKVYEYLKDALEKEQQAEGLYMKLVDYENTINNILVEKVTLDIENKRLAKQIELSEKKLNVLGNRLIEVARNRAEYDSDEDYYYD